jgi:putative MATE family efflux protein
MKVRATSRHIWAVSVPVIIAGLSEKIVEITDIVFLGRYGTTELAAVGLADAIYAVCLFITLGLADGLQIIIARRAGQGRLAEIGKVFNQGIYMLSATAVLSVVGIQLLSPYVTAALIRSSDITRAVDDFLQIFSYAMLFHGANLALSAFYVGISRTRVLIGATVVLSLINIVLDYILIFGHLGFPSLGIQGAAIASLAAEVGAFGVLLFYAIRQRFTQRYGLFRFGRWNGALARKLLEISYPVALDALVETTRWLIFFLIIEQMGELALACANIVYSCYALLLIPLEGFSETACSMVSNLVGQQESGKIGGLLRRAMSLSLVVVLPFLVLVLLLPEQVLSIFTSDTELIANGVNSLRVVVLAVAIVIPGEIFYSAVAGTGDTMATFVIELALTTCILAYAYVTAIRLGLPLEIVWLAEVVGWLICLTLSWGWLRAGRWRRLQV